MQNKTEIEFLDLEENKEYIDLINGENSFIVDFISQNELNEKLSNIEAMKENIILIAGGYDKHIPYDDLGVKIVEKVKNLILMGDTASRIEEAVKKAPNYSIFNPTIVKVTNMEEAVAEAYKRSLKGDIVSLSPASASFDLYKDFDARGKDFKRLVNLLEERK
mgnify:CR=1 FL=1